MTRSDDAAHAGSMDPVYFQSSQNSRTLTCDEMSLLCLPVTSLLKVAKIYIAVNIKVQKMLFDRLSL